MADGEKNGNESLRRNPCRPPTICRQEIFAQEKEQIFFREWFCAGREEQLPKPGDFLVLDVAGESVLVVRTKDGGLKAHYNVCRHRGAQLCAPLTPLRKMVPTAICN